MELAFEIFGTILFLSMTIALLCGAGYVSQLVIERFVLSTIPILVDLYGRIRYPDEYKN